MIVEGTNREAGCGNHSCFIAIYQKVSDGETSGYRKLLQGTGFGFDIGPNRTRGYLDVHDMYTLSAFEYVKETYKWNGKKYIVAKCVHAQRDSDSESDRSDAYIYKPCEDHFVR